VAAAAAASSARPAAPRPAGVFILACSECADAGKAVEALVSKAGLQATVVR